MSVTRPIRIALIIAGVLLFAVAAVWVNLPTFDRLSFKLGDFDLIGMLKEVDRTNTAILKANNELIASLEGVRQQAGAVSGVYGRMQKLETGLGEQAQVMGRLDGITRQQADLSAALRRLTAGVGPSTELLAATASQQAVAVEAMGRTTAGMAERMESIGALNSSIRAKMWTAERLSGETLDLLPP